MALTEEQQRGVQQVADDLHNMAVKQAKERSEAEGKFVITDVRLERLYSNNDTGDAEEIIRLWGQYGACEVHYTNADGYLYLTQDGVLGHFEDLPDGQALDVEVFCSAVNENIQMTFVDVERGKIRDIIRAQCDRLNKLAEENNNG